MHFRRLRMQHQIGYGALPGVADGARTQSKRRHQASHSHSHRRRVLPLLHWITTLDNSTQRTWRHPLPRLVGIQVCPAIGWVEFTIPEVTLKYPFGEVAD